MSNNKNAIIALLSTDSLLNRESIKEIQSNLHEVGFTQNSARYPNPDGIAGPLTRADLIDFIKQNPETLLTMSDESVEFFRARGLDDELEAIVNDNPEIRQALVNDAKEILNGRNIDELHGTPELKDLQSKLSLLGEYNGKIDGFTGRLSRGAVTSLKDEFTAAALPEQVPEGPKREADNEQPTRDIETEAEVATNPNQSQTELYMTALGFREEGLKRGDGGEKNWNNKRDPEVWNLQVMLNRAGADIAVDADYGGQTVSAVRAFQEQHDLPVTGQADPETLMKLASLPETQFSAEGQSNPREYTTIEHHAIIAKILPQVTNDTGVSGGYLQAVRGKETYGGKLFSSGTGSDGPYHITGRTFVGLINDHGDKIAENLRAIGQDELADSVLDSQAGTVNKDLRYDPYISTYAAAFYTVERGIDTMNPDNWGRAYAAHNVGGGGLNTILQNLNTPNVGAVLDRKYDPDPAANNPAFFSGGATGQTVLNRYQDDMELWSSEYDDRVQPQLDALAEMQQETAANNVLVAPVTQAQVMTAGKSI